ncbi:hypothetical protein [Fischerella sp. JS2]|nr:hypothetical protein [Fischerella sp. JS2]
MNTDKQRTRATTGGTPATQCPPDDTDGFSVGGWVVIGMFTI